MDRKRKVCQMNDIECMDHSNTADGLKPLTNPLSLNFSHARNGLVPQDRRRCHSAIVTTPGGSTTFCTSSAGCCPSVLSEFSNSADRSNNMISGHLSEAEEESLKTAQMEEIKSLGGFMSARQYMKQIGRAHV